MEAFRRYDFENNENWKAYLRSVELPLARELDEATLRVKARWYKKNVDPDFDPNYVSKAGGGQPPSQGARNTGASANTSHANRRESSADTGKGGGYTARGPSVPPTLPPRYGTGGSGTYGSIGAQQRLFLLHSGIVLLGVYIAVPLLPYTRTAYVNLMRLCIATLGYKMYLQHGLPPFRPFSMLMPWLQRVMPTSDFIQFITIFIFSVQPPLLLVTVPLTVLAIYHAAAFCAAHFPTHPLWQRYGRPMHAVLIQRQADALLFNAFCEVGTAAVLLFQLMTPARSFLTLLLYGNVLKLKLHLPDSAHLHRQVWRKIDEVTLPYRHRVPVLERLIQLAVGWFMSVPGAR